MNTKTVRQRGAALLVFLYAILGATAAWGQFEYTLQQTADHLASLVSNPYVRPTPSAMAFDGGSEGIEPFIIGRTLGTAGGGYTWQGQTVPAQNIYGFQMTNFAVTQPKAKVLIVGGQHPNESHSLYSLQGMVDFILGGSSAAQSLRNLADFYVYPQVNPEGRWAGNDAHRSNPENPGLDNNRVWDDPAGWTNVTIARNAMFMDTQSSNVGYVFDYHSPGATGTDTWIYATAGDSLSPFSEAVEGRGIPIRVSSGHPGMLRIWSKGSPFVGGLGTSYGFTPEIGLQPEPNPELYYGFGEDIARALNDALISSRFPSDLPPLTAEFRIDFNDRLVSGEAGWNVIAAADSNTNVSLVTSDGSMTSVTLTVPGISHSNNNGWNPANTLPDWATIEAANDYVFFGDDVDFVISGLGPDRLFDIELIMSRDLDRESLVTIGDFAAVWNDQADGYLAGNTLVLKNVPTDWHGNLRLQFYVSGISGALNSMRIVGVPEPSSLAWLALVGLLLVRRRAR